MTNPERWSDDKLETFYQEFRGHVIEFHAHVGDGVRERQQQQELYEAVFRKESIDTGTPPGLLQLTARISGQLHDIKVWQDRQKTFIGGALFAITSVWFLLTEVWPRFFAWIGVAK